MCCSAALLICVQQATCNAEPNSIPTSSDFLLQVWRMDDGLPNNNVSALAQTPDGYIWVGTARGLARFDGVRFITFNRRNTKELVSDSVDCLATDSNDGSLWIGVNPGSLMHWQSGVFRSVVSLPKSADRLIRLSVSGSKSVWGGLANGQMMQWREGEARFYGPSEGFSARGRVLCTMDTEGRTWYASLDSFGYFENNKPVPLETNKRQYFNLAPSRAGGVWIRGNAGLQRITTNFVSDAIVGTGPSNINYLQVMLEDADGAIWMGTRGNGLYRYCDGKLERIPTSHDSILSLCEDQEGDVWVGTMGGGLNRISPRVARIYNSKAGLPRSFVTSLCEDNEGRLWFATRNAHLTSLSESRNKIELHSAGWTNLEEFASVLCNRRSGGIWLAADRVGLFYWQDGKYQSTGFNGMLITSLFEDSKESLWVVANGGLFQLKDGKPKRVDSDHSLGEITAIAEDQEGTLWMGNQEGAVYGRRSGGSEFVLHPALMKPSGFPIQVIFADGPDSLWVGTRGGGLLRMSGGKLSSITSEQGIPDDDIRQILPDDSGNVWVGSASGLFRARKIELEAVAAGRSKALDCLIFGASYGLGNIEFQEGFRNTMCRTRDGHLWFATTLGAVEVDPRSAAPKLNPPTVHIEQVAVDGQVLSLHRNRPVVVPPGSRRLEIKFTATSFRAIENVRFRHRLDSLDADWVDAGAERTVSYYRVPPGEYRFRVNARGSNGRWNEEGAFVDIIVEPTLWQMGWIRATVFTAVLVMVAMVVRITANRRWQRKMKEFEQKQAVELERRRIARDMHDELGAGLTQLAFMGEQSRKKFSGDANVSARMEQISKTAKDIASKLDQIVWIVNPRNDTLEQLIGYLSQYTIDYLAPTDIKFSQELPLETPKHKIDSHVRHELLMAFKEVLTNAVKHSGAQNISLSIQLKELQLRVTLADDGRGFKPQEMSGLGDGLGNLRQRLEALGGSCHLESKPKTGTAVTLTLPLGHAS